MTDGRRGPAGDYDPAYVEQARKLCMLGATDAEIADFFEVSVRTVARWKTRHEEFAQALVVGKTLADERVRRSLYHKAVGYDFVEQQAIKVKLEQHREEVQIVDVEKHMPPDTTAQIFWLKNRDPENWRDKVTAEHTGKDGEPIAVSAASPRDLARAMALVVAKGLKNNDAGSGS